MGGQVVTTLCACAVAGPSRGVCRQCSVTTSMGGSHGRELEQRGVDTSCLVRPQGANRQAVIIVERRASARCCGRANRRWRFSPIELPVDGLLSRRASCTWTAWTPAPRLEAARRGATRPAPIVTCDLDPPIRDRRRCSMPRPFRFWPSRSRARSTRRARRRARAALLGRRHAGTDLRDPGRARRAAARRRTTCTSRRSPDVKRRGHDRSGRRIPRRLHHRAARGNAARGVLRFATAAAAISCTRVGAVAGVPSRSEIEAFFASRPG